MKTIILPGYSLHNKNWAEQVKADLKLDHEVLVHYWRHWETGGGMNTKEETERILQEIGKDKVSIIAKSVGTGITMQILPKIKSQVRKVILCGIPGTSDEKGNFFETALKDFPVKNVICIQNKKDPFATYREVKDFIASINPGIPVVEKPRNDHHYPYHFDFNAFLTAS